MKRPELLLGGAVVAVAAFVLFEARTAPPRAGVASVTDTASASGDGRALSRVRSSNLPPPTDRDYASIRSRIAAARGTTYVDDILAARDNHLARWVDRRESPIAVWIQPRPGLRDFWPQFRDRATEAFYTWSAVGVPVRFVFVDDSTAAEVRLRWVDRFPDAAAGKTYWERDQNWWIMDADIEIAVHRTTGQAYDGPAIRAITLHEVGHVIGLDHSSYPDDIMAARVHVMGLSQRDLRTSTLIYTLPPGSVLAPREPRTP